MNPPLHPDHAHVEAAHRREPAAVEWLAQRLTCVPRMVQQLSSRFGGLPTQELADVAQDVAVVVLRRLASYHGLAPFEAWVHRICLHTLHSFVRRRRNRATGSLDEEPADQGELPTTRLQEQERRDLLLGAIDRVGGAEAELLRFRHLDGLDFAEISRRTGIGMATLRTRYYRGLKRVQQNLATSSSFEEHRE